MTAKLVVLLIKSEVTNGMIDTLGMFKFLKAFHFVNRVCTIFRYENKILFTKPFQANQSWHQLSVYENKFLVQICLRNEWTLHYTIFSLPNSGTHCAFSSNLFHGQIVQIAILQLSDPENKKCSP